MVGVVQIINIDSSMVTASEWGEKGMGSNCLIDKEFARGRDFCMWMTVMVVQQNECT